MYLLLTFISGNQFFGLKMVGKIKEVKMKLHSNVF